MFTNITPSGISLRIVVPRRLPRRDRFMRRFRFAASAVVPVLSTWSSREPSRYTVTPSRQ